MGEIIIDKSAQVNHPMYGKIEYDVDGKPICAICGKPFKKVLTHVNQAHGITASEYKFMFGLDKYKGIICKELRDRLREHLEANYDVAVTENLNRKGLEYKFKKGNIGRTKDKVSEQTRRKLRKNIEKANMSKITRRIGDEEPKLGDR